VRLGGGTGGEFRQEGWIKRLAADFQAGQAGQAGQARWSSAWATNTDSAARLAAAPSATFSWVRVLLLLCPLSPVCHASWHLCSQARRVFQLCRGVARRKGFPWQLYSVFQRTIDLIAGSGADTSCGTCVPHTRMSGKAAVCARFVCSWESVYRPRTA